MKIDIKRYNCCDRWHFYNAWIPGRLLAVHLIGQDRFNATARNLRNRALKCGYVSRHESWTEWNEHLQDIFSVNSSMPYRQGREMSEPYMLPPDRKMITNPCRDHQYHLVTVSLDGKWFAYAVIHVMGGLCNISTIIGHGLALRHGIMYLLMDEIINVCKASNVIALDYGEWASGTDGLRTFKHSTGFKPMQLTI